MNKTLIHIRMILALTLARRWEVVHVVERWDDTGLDKWLDGHEVYELDDEDMRYHILWSDCIRWGHRINGLPDPKGEALEAGIYFFTGAYETGWGTDDAGRMPRPGEVSGTLHAMKPEVSVMSLIHGGI